MAFLLTRRNLAPFLRLRRRPIFSGVLFAPRLIMQSVGRPSWENNEGPYILLRVVAGGRGKEGLG